MVLESFGGSQAYRIRSSRLRDPIVRLVNEMYGIRNSDRVDFPGAQPCSVLRENLEILATRHYVVAEKTDGTRYLMLVTRSAEPSDLVIMIDRSMSMWIVPLFFRAKVHDEKCLFDGELVFNERHQCWEYQIFELVKCGARIRMRDSYIHRLQIARAIVKNELLPAESHLPPRAFNVDVKHFYPTHKIDQLLSIRKQNRTDGLIFTPVTPDVKPYRNRNMFKWKNGLDHTIDCLLKYNEQKAQQLKKAKTPAKTLGEGDESLEKSIYVTPVKKEVAKKEEDSLEAFVVEEEEEEEEEDVEKSEDYEESGSEEEEEDEDGGQGKERTKIYLDFQHDKIPQIIRAIYRIQQTKAAIEARRRGVALRPKRVVVAPKKTEKKKKETKKRGGNKKKGSGKTMREINAKKKEAEKEKAAADREKERAEKERQSAAAETNKKGEAEEVKTVSPSNIELAAFEFWLVDGDKRLVYFADVDMNLNRAFLSEHAMEVVAGGRDMIVECRYMHGTWKIALHRTDREAPNAEYTVEKTLQNIRENITLEEIAEISRNNVPPQQKLQQQQQNQNQNKRKEPEEREGGSSVFSNPFSARPSSVPLSVSASAYSPYGTPPSNRYYPQQQQQRRQDDYSRYNNNNNNYEERNNYRADSGRGGRGGNYSRGRGDYYAEPYAEEQRPVSTYGGYGNDAQQYGGVRGQQYYIKNRGDEGESRGRGRGGGRGGGGRYNNNNYQPTPTPPQPQPQQQYAMMPASYYVDAFQKQQQQQQPQNHPPPAGFDFSEYDPEDEQYFNRRPVFEEDVDVEEETEKKKEYLGIQFMPEDDPRFYQTNNEEEEYDPCNPGFDAAKLLLGNNTSQVTDLLSQLQQSLQQTPNSVLTK